MRPSLPQIARSKGEFAITLAIKTHQTAFGLDLSNSRRELLADYYDLIVQRNEFLHLVAPTTEEEFAVRHILESLMLLKHLPPNAHFADVGAGAGLPSIPCLLAREDLTAVLIESKIKKSNFLMEAIGELNIADRAQIINKQFEETDGRNFSFITCRALDKFSEKLPRLLKWAKHATFLLFGGNFLRDALTKEKRDFIEELMPLSQQRFLFCCPTSMSKENN